MIRVDKGNKGTNKRFVIFRPMSGWSIDSARRIRRNVRKASASGRARSNSSPSCCATHLLTGPASLDRGSRSWRKKKNTNTTDPHGRAQYEDQLNQYEDHELFGHVETVWRQCEALRPCGGPKGWSRGPVHLVFAEIVLMCWSTPFQYLSETGQCSVDVLMLLYQLVSLLYLISWAIPKHLRISACCWGTRRRR